MLAIVTWLSILIFSATVGSLLGTHFKVFVLAPTMLFASASTFAAGFISGANPRIVVFALLAILAALQFGFVSGGVAVARFGARSKSRSSTGRPSKYY